MTVKTDIEDRTCSATRLLDDPAQDGLSRAHIPVILVVTLALAFDLGEIALGGALSAVFSSPPYLSPAGDVGLLLASVYVGGALGAGPFGYFADRFGRRRVIIIMLLVVAAGSGLAAISGNIVQLTWMRGLTGIALGVLPTILISYLTELLPERKRGSRLMALSAVAFFGGPLLLLLVSAIEPAAPLGLDAWRWALLAGGTGSLICGLLFLLLPESPNWLRAVGRADEAEIVTRRFAASPPLRLPRWVRSLPQRQLASQGPAPGPWLPRAALLCLLCAAAPVATIAFPVLSGAIMVERGFSLNDSVLYLGLSSFGYIFGALLAAPVIDHIQRKVALALAMAAMAAGLLTFAMAQQPAILIASCGLFFAAAATYAILLSIYAAELFETGMRGRLTSLGWGILRIASVVAILWLTPLLRTNGPDVVLMVMLGSVLVSGLLVIVFAPSAAADAPFPAIATEAGTT